MAPVDPAPSPTPAVEFPTWARIFLGLVITVVTYIVSGDVIHIDEDTRALLTALVLIVSSAGIVPPSPESVNLSPTVRLVLTVVVVVLGYVLTKFIIPADDPVLRGIISAALALFSSVGIVPPQALVAGRQALRR